MSFCQHFAADLNGGTDGKRRILRLVGIQYHQAQARNRANTISPSGTIPMEKVNRGQGAAWQALISLSLCNQAKGATEGAK